MNDIFSVTSETTFGKDAQRLIIKILKTTFPAIYGWNDITKKGSDVLNDLLIQYPLGENYENISDYLASKGVYISSSDDYDMILTVQFVYSLVNWYIIYCDNRRLMETDSYIHYKPDLLESLILGPLEKLLDSYSYSVLKMSDDPDQNIMEDSWMKCYIYENDDLEVVLAGNIKSENQDVIRLKTVILDFLKVENKQNRHVAYSLMAHIYQNYELDAKSLLKGRTITRLSDNNNQDSIKLFDEIMKNENDNGLGGQSLRHRVEKELGKKTLPDQEVWLLGRYLAKCFLIAYSFDEIYDLRDQVRDIKI